MDASCTIQDNIHLYKLNIYVSRILGTHQITIFESLPLSSALNSKYYLFNRLYNVLTCIPVAPFGKYPSGLDRYAVPAISK